MDEPEATLDEVARLRRRARERAHGGAWLPTAAIAVLLLTSVSLYRYPFASANVIVSAYPFWAGLPDEQRSLIASYVYWFVGVPLVLALTAVWYRWRGRRVGMRVAWRPFVITALGLLALLAVLAAVPKGDVSSASTDHLSPQPHQWLWTGLLTPLLPIAAAVFALGWVERSRVLALTGLWIALLAIWLCGTAPLGSFPGWVDWLLNGGGGPGLGGQLALRPGHYLVLMALPLLVFAAVQLLRRGRATA